MLNCAYNPHKNNICNHLDVITKKLDAYYSKYANVVFLGDINAAAEGIPMKSFWKSYNLTSLIKQPTCLKNSEKPSCIDLILTNKPKSFQSTCVIETGLSDFHKTLCLSLKCTFKNFHQELLVTGIFLIMIMQTL